MKPKQKYALLVPCYNASSYIDDFIKHLSAQTRPFDEVLFYDDASTDNTAELLLAQGVKVIKGDKNHGAGHARNQLAANTACEWFHFHDIDDKLNPDYLLKTAQIAENSQNDVILCNADWYDAYAKKLILSWKYSNIQINQNPLAYTIANPIGGINGLYRKSKFMETGGFNTSIRIWEDADIHVKLAARKARFHVIEEVLSLAFRYSISASSDQGLGWLTRLNLLQEYFGSFEDKTVRAAIGRQAQLLGSNLIISKQPGAAKKALELSEMCNVKVPQNNSGIWHLLKAITPKSFRINLRLLQLRLAFNKR